MDKQYDFLYRYLENITVLKWDIIHDLKLRMPPTDTISFSTDRKTDHRYPFDFHLGYLCLKDENDETGDVLNQYSEMLMNLVDRFTGNLIALGNIFIIILRSSFRGDDKGDLIERFKSRIGAEQSVDVFLILNDSLSETLYKNNNNIIKSPQNVEEWIKLFRAASYLDCHALDYNQLLKLISQESIIDFQWTSKIPPVVLVILIDFYGLKISFTYDIIKKMDCFSEKKIAFTVAYIIESFHHPEALEWFNCDVADSLILTHWDQGGKELINRLCLEKTKQQNNKSSTNLNLIYTALANSITKKLKDDKFTAWLKELSFPREHINVLNLALEYTKVCDGGYDLSQLSEVFKSTLLNNVFDAICKSEPLIKGLINNNTSFSIFELHTLDTNYENYLVVLCCQLLNEDSGLIKVFENLCFEYRQYFYCEYDSLRIAVEFVEFILLVLLSIVNIPELDNNQLKMWKNLVGLVIDIVLYPYVAVAEEEEYIWNPEYDFMIDYPTKSKYYLNRYLHDLYKSKYRAVADDLFSKLSEHKTAIWPYERLGTIYNEPHE